MLLNLIGSGTDIKTALAQILLTIPMILIALCVHEASHGYVAYLCGDSTAKAHGRLTLNPLKHLDPLGTLCMLLAGFGWAKPVPVVTRNFRKPRRDMFLVAFAGPASNLLLAFVLTPVFYFACWGEVALQGSKFALPMALLCFMIYFGILANIGLALFNLLPIPPLDGSNMLLTTLPPKLAMKYAQLGRYSSLIIIGLFAISRFTPISVLYPLEWLRGVILNLFMNIFSFMI